MSRVRNSADFQARVAGKMIVNDGDATTGG